MVLTFKKRKNVLLLFTEDKNYAQPTIVMTDMTSKLSSTKALKEYLNI